MGFTSQDDGWETRGESRGGSYAYDEPPERARRPGSGHGAPRGLGHHRRRAPAWRAQVRGHGAHPTDVIDRHYFRSIYFREPSGVLFELATPSPGFTVDEPLETLGEKLSIPPFLESRRADIEATVKPLDYRRAVSTEQ